MLDAENSTETTPTGASPDAPPDAGEATAKTPAKKAAAKRTTAKKTATKKTTTAKKAPAKRTTRKVAATTVQPSSEETAGATEEPTPTDEATAAAPAAKKTTKKAAAKKAPVKRTTKKAVATADAPADTPAEPAQGPAAEEAATAAPASATSATAPLFQPPDPTKALPRRKSTAKATSADAATGSEPGTDDTDTEPQRPAKKAAARKRSASPKAERADQTEQESTTPSRGADEDTDDSEDSGDEQGGERRRRRRGGRRRRRGGGGDGDNASQESSQDTPEAQGADTGPEDQKGSDDGEDSSGTRRRRRRRRSGEGPDGSDGDSNTTTRARKPRNAEDEITAVTGSTRLEAKKQRRREGREAGRRRAPIVSEAEFLARREAVDRVMVIRQKKDLTQIAVMEDKVLVEHYVARESQTSLIGNVYLGRVQNVLPSMEAAFIDIGKGRNAVLYAGEVNWDALGAKNGTPRKIEAVLKSGQPILVQVTKDPVGHKGARLTSQVSLPGRFLVYVPDGTTSGISRKLPDTERNRLKSLLKEIVPDSAGVIVRTAAEGASEDELTRDVERLTARWADIEGKVEKGNAPQLLYGEPDLTLKVVRDLFTEDFSKLVISGDDAWDLVQGYVSHVAPDLEERLERYDGGRDVFADHRIDEQIEKALDRKVWLPSGGSLVIDRTEAMTVVDVNTGKFTGSGGNLEETVTKNNLEAAEEIVRQLRLRDIGGIIVVDFIDMVLESNRDLVLRRMVECLGRDRTRHQVAEVTSLGLVQMTRKRIGTGLLEAFSEACEHCQGRGLVLHHEPIEPSRKSEDDSRRGGRRAGRGRGRDDAASGSGGQAAGVPSPKDVAAMARHEDRDERASRPEPAKADDAEGAAPAAEATATSATDTPEDAEQTREQGRSRSRRSRGSASRPQGAAVSSDATPDADTAAAPSDSSAATDESPAQSFAESPAESPDTEGASEPAAAPVTRTTTRTRGGRGRATRPAGAHTPSADPTDVAAAESAAVVSVAQAEPSPEGSPAATDGGGEAEASATPDEASVEAAPPAPRIVTTTRRRSARRPAGPPAGGAAAAEASAQGSVPTGADGSGSDGSGPNGSGPEETPATPHVPVKKRGSRRR